MSHPKKTYDTTLARIAGNIASGHGMAGAAVNEAGRQKVAELAVDLAARIVALCEARNGKSETQL